MNVRSKFPKTVKVKTYLLTLMLVSVIFLSTIAYVASQGGFTAPNIYLDSLPSTMSYVISTDGTYYWSTRYDGTITFSSTNPSTVLQFAIGNLTSGGSIFVKKATYSMPSTVTDGGKNNIWIFSDGAILQWVASVTNGFDISDSYGWRFDGLTLIGKFSTSKGIYGSSSVNNTSVTNCNFTNWGYAAINLEGSSTSCTIENNYFYNTSSNDCHVLMLARWGAGAQRNHKIRGNLFENCSGESIELVQVFDSLIESNTIVNCGGSGIELAYSGDCVITNNIIRKTSGLYVPLHIEEASYNVSISNNFIYTSLSAKEAVYIEEASSYISLVNNRIISTAGVGIRVDNSDYCFIALNDVSAYNQECWIEHGNGTSDYNRFLGNRFEVLAQSDGSPTGNTYELNYPDNTP